MNPERPYPKLPKAHVAGLVAGYALLASLAVWLMWHFVVLWLIPVLALVPVLVVIVYWRTRRCPECRGALKRRKDYFPNSTRFRSLLDCPRCRITWNTGKFGDDDP